MSGFPLILGVFLFILGFHQRNRFIQGVEPRTPLNTPLTWFIKRNSRRNSLDQRPRSSHLNSQHSPEEELYSSLLRFFTPLLFFTLLPLTIPSPYIFLPHFPFHSIPHFPPLPIHTTLLP